jgi:uncharacterized membrane protein
MKSRRFSARERVVAALAGLSVVCLGFYVIGAITNDSTQFSYLTWNLFLAWLPLVFAAFLLLSLRKRLWSQWQPVFWTLLWLLFLPNSFYIISDFVHIQEITGRNLLYDIAMFTAFAFNGVLIGFISVYLVHVQLLKRIGRLSGWVIGLVIFLSSFAIYLGRDLRWNSWDVLTNPAGILFDVSDRLLHPSQHINMMPTVLSFFVLLGALYVVGWQIGKATHHEN